MPEPADALDPARFALLAGVGLALAFVLAAVSRAPVRRPVAVLVALGAISLAACASLVGTDPPRLRLAVDPSTEPLLPDGDPDIEVYRRAVLDFGGDEIFVIAMETDDLFRPQHLEALRRVGDRIARLDEVRAVTSLANVTSFRYRRDEDWIEVRPFLDDVPQREPELDALRERAVGSRIYRQNLVSSDARTAALNVSFREMTDGEFIASRVDARIRAILDDETRDGRRFFVSGRPHVKSVMYAAMTRDLAVLIPLALCVVGVALAFATGLLRAVLLPLATVATAILWTFGAIALLERPLTVLTVLLAPTLVAIGSVYPVHLVSRYEEEAPDAPDPVSAVRRSLAPMVLPVAIAGLTTLAGFAALLLTDVPAVFELGAFSLLGIASITLLTLTGVPACLALLPLPAPGSGAARVAPLLDRALARVARASARRSGAVLTLWAAAVGVALAAIPRIDVDTDYLSWFAERAPVRRDFEAIDRLLAGAVPLYVVIDSGAAGGLRDPGLLRAIGAVQERLDELPRVGRTLSLLDSLRALNRAIEGDDPAAERVPDSREAVAELLFLLPKNEMQRFATVDQRAANVIVRTGAVGSAAMRALTARIEAVLADARLPAGASARVTGNAILLNRAADGVARRQPLTVGMAALAVFTLLTISLRSPRFGLLAMVPNAVPVLLFFGVLGLGAAPLSLPTSLIGSVALGLAIDATAHYLVRYRDERRAGRSPEEAALRCGRRVGRPIAVASCVLMLGFASVAFSEFQTLRDFGLLTALTLGICLAADLTLLPALLVRLRP